MEMWKTQKARFPHFHRPRYQRDKEKREPKTDGRGGFYVIGGGKIT